MCQVSTLSSCAVISLAVVHTRKYSTAWGEPEDHSLKDGVYKYQLLYPFIKSMGDSEKYVRCLSPAFS